MTRESAAAVRAAVIRACRRLDARGLVAGAEGNVSARVGARRIVVTPAGAAKGELGVRDLVEVDVNGIPVRRGASPSTELPMHLAIYAARPDVRAIVHAHPVAATGFAVAHRRLPVAGLAELAGVVGPVPLVAYRMPGTPHLGLLVAKSLAAANVALLANHGAVAVGANCNAALHLMESLEQSARILVTAHILGGVTGLGQSDVKALGRARTGAGSTAPRNAKHRRRRRS